MDIGNYLKMRPSRLIRAVKSPLIAVITLATWRTRILRLFAGGGELDVSRRVMAWGSFLDTTNAISSLGAALQGLNRCAAPLLYPSVAPNEPETYSSVVQIPLWRKHNRALLQLRPSNFS